jgi:hypothetical protein
MTQIIEAVERTHLQVPQNTPQIKNKAFIALKQFVVMRLLWQMRSKLKLFLP